MGERFKTGYLADRTSFSELGQKIGNEITSSIEKIGATRKQRQLELDSRMGFTKAQNEALPSGLSGRYMKGAQAALQSMQEKAAIAYASGNASDVQAYQMAKQEYNDLKNIGVSVSARERQIVDNIAVGSFNNLTGTIPEALDEYRQHDQGDFKYEGGQLMFVDADGSESPWRESRINDPRGGFLPQLKWEGSDYMVSSLATEIYTNNLSGKEGLYQEKFEGTDFQRGEIIDSKFYEDVQQAIDAKFMSDPNSMAEAMSMHGYKVKQVPSKSELSQQDVTAAGAIYSTEALSGDNKFLRGSLNAQGVFEFAVDMEDFPDAVDETNRKLVVNAREAKKTYYESVSSDLRERIKLDDESGKYLTKLDEEAKELYAAQLEALGDSQEAIAQAPSLIVDAGGSQYTMVHTADSRYKMKLDGKPLTVDETYFELVDGPDGKLVPIEVGFKVSATMSRNDMINELIQNGEDQGVAANVVNNWFNKYDNTIISRTQLDANTNNRSIDPRFLKILTGLNNGVQPSGAKPGANAHRALAKQKILLHKEGKLLEGSLTSNGIQMVQPVSVTPTATTPAATTPAASVTPTGAAAAATTPAATTPAATTPASSTPAATTPAATTPSANTPATSTPATPTTATTTQATPAPADSAATPAPEPEPEPVNLQVAPTAEEVQMDNIATRAVSALRFMDIKDRGEMSTLNGVLGGASVGNDVAQKLQEGMVPVYINFSAKDYLNARELKALEDKLFGDGQRGLITYLPIEELEEMSAASFSGWRMNFEQEEVERLKKAVPSEQPTEDAATSTNAVQTEPEVSVTATNGDETDLANIVIPEASVPAEQTRREEEERELTVTYSPFYKSLEELADFDEDLAERVQDYYESLPDGQSDSFVRMVSNNYKKEPRQYPTIIGGMLKFVTKPEGEQ